MKPELIAINRDEDHATFIGHIQDGRQFLLTAPFIPASKAHPGSEFIALYLFDSHGLLLEAKIEEFGPRATVDDVKRRKTHDTWLAELGDVSFGRIEVAPFSIIRFGTAFGLVPREPEDEEDVWAVEMQPGNYMAFFEPWDSGDYDT